MNLYPWVAHVLAATKPGRTDRRPPRARPARPNGWPTFTFFSRSKAMQTEPKVEKGDGRNAICAIATV